MTDRAAAPIARKSFYFAGTAIALLAASPAVAGEISGTAVDGSDTRTLQAAEVTIVELNRVATTGRDGSYRFPDVPAGDYTLEAHYVGADTVRTTVTVPTDGTVNVPLVFGAPDDIILVIGQAANQASALSRQRAADGMSSVVTRDAIGQFPDQNVAESLRRLPGVNILNDQGEGRFVSIRGLDPELNSASVNGVRLPAPESDVRSVALDVISSDIIESIEIKKSLTPDMDADTIGGSIEISTTSAFDRTRDLFKVRAEGSYNDLMDSLTPKLGFDFSTRLSDDFGVSGGVSYYQREFATDNIEADGWNEADGIVLADTLEYRDYDVERERISATLNFDYRLSDSTSLYVRGLYSQFDDQEDRRRLIFEMDADPSSGTADTASFDANDGEITVQRDLKDRFERQRIRSLVFGGETETGPWKIDWSASWSKASERENGSIDPVVFERQFEDEDFGVTFDYSRADYVGYTIDAGSADFLDPAEFEFEELEFTSLSDSQDEEYALRLDVAHSFAMGSGDFTVQAGGKGRWREKFYNGTFDIYDGFDGDDDLTLATSGMTGDATYGLADIDPVPAKRTFRTFFNANRSAFELNELDSLIASAESDYAVDEDVFAGYILGRWDSATLRVIGGVRFERTENQISGNILTLIPEEEDDEGEVIQEEGVLIESQSFERSYTDWMPSLTVRFEPSNGLVFRAAGYRSLVRPKLSFLAPRVVIEDNEGEGGNPFLLPYKAWNFDLSAEYYFGRNAAISGGFFYKDIEDYVVQQVSDDVAYNGVVLDQFTQPINGDSAEIFGFEASYNQLFDFLPAPFDGLLAQLNYTFTDATGTVFEDGELGDPREIPLPASSRHTFNAVFGYEKGPLSLRVSGTYRDRYLDELNDTAEEDRYVADHFQLDLSAKYRVLPGVRVFAEAVNITDEPYFAYQNFEGSRRLLQYEEYSFTLKFGVTAEF